MEQQVETYEAISLDEHGGVIVDEETSIEALALIETLGLTGQQGLVKTKAVEGTVETTETRNPYRLVTVEEARVFMALFPQVVKVKDYRGGAIPLRVLQVIAHAKPLFKELYVMSPKDARDPDPILIGMNPNPQWSWTKDCYILARWGDVLVPFEELKEKARKRIENTARMALMEAKQTVAMFEATFDVATRVFVDGGKAEDSKIELSFGPSIIALP